MLSQDGARHRPLKGLALGTATDVEDDGQPSTLADGDDRNPTTGTDEDGVKFVTDPLIAGQSAQVQVIATIPAKSSSPSRPRRIMNTTPSV